MFLKTIKSNNVYMNILVKSVYILLTLSKFKTAKTVSAADVGDLGHGRVSADRGWNIILLLK